MRQHDLLLLFVLAVSPLLGLAVQARLSEPGTDAAADDPFPLPDECLRGVLARVVADADLRAFAQTCRRCYGLVRDRLWLTTMVFGPEVGDADFRRHLNVACRPEWISELRLMVGTEANAAYLVQRIFALVLESPQWCFRTLQFLISDCALELVAEFTVGKLLWFYSQSESYSDCALYDQIAAIFGSDHGCLSLDGVPDGFVRLCSSVVEISETHPAFRFVPAEFKSLSMDLNTSVNEIRFSPALFAMMFRCGVILPAETLIELQFSGTFSDVMPYLQCDQSNVLVLLFCLLHYKLYDDLSDLFRSRLVVLTLNQNPLVLFRICETLLDLNDLDALGLVLRIPYVRQFIQDRSPYPAVSLTDTFWKIMGQHSDPGERFAGRRL